MVVCVMYDSAESNFLPSTSYIHFVQTGPGNILGVQHRAV